MLSLKFYLTEKEYFDYNYYTVWAGPHKKGYRVRYYIRVFALYSMIAILYILINHSHKIEIDLLVFAIVAIIYFLLVPRLIKHSIKRKTRQILAEAENKHVLDESEIILTESGIIDQDSLSQDRYNWDAIVKKSETSDCYYLYTNSHHAIVIPKRSIKTAEEQKELDRLFNRFLSLSSEFAS
jgi:hypothetical protein